jgi:hypothetical protein
MQNLSAIWLYPVILAAGALQASNNGREANNRRGRNGPGATSCTATNPRGKRRTSICSSKEHGPADHR